ncbi:VOC family protein [Streptomyces kunmingensis]|uniref:VOC family protein n=1 Tax=Streptomyces kunmingensis TaxID=68225 RepID=A0ABU6C8D5_9ACTN|nr:VOC family protein [Streptomyces kunmingensis]MEB3960978.1 VOC family protein [Streptomyces kunmingensis]
MSQVEAAVLVFDCAEPEELCEFYRVLLDGEIQPPDGGNRVELVGAGGTRLAFRRDLNAAPASWPRPDDSQQAHLDLLVAAEHLDEVERQIVGLGARPLETRGTKGRTETRLYADPAGHPFSLRSAEHLPKPKAH